MLLAALVAIVLIAVVSQTGVDPWHDEAMLIANLLVPDLSLTSPLPYYEQAAPIGYVWLARLVLGLAGAEPPFHALRLLSVGFFIVGTVLVLFSRPLRNDRNGAIAFVALLLVSPLVWSYAAEIKHYSAEFFASALVLAFGWPLISNNRSRDLIAFAAAVGIASAFSFTLPVIVAGMLAAIAAMRLMAWRANGSQGTVLAPSFIATSILCVVGVAALHLVLNRNLVSYQMSAYSHVYVGTDGRSTVQLLLSRILGVLDVAVNALGSEWFSALRNALIENGLPEGPAYHVTRLIAATAMLVLILLAWRRSAAVAVTSFFTLGALAVLMLAGLVQMPYSRHIIFLLPLSGLITSLAIASVLETVLSAKYATPALTAVLALCVVSGAKGGVFRETQQISPILQRIDEVDAQAPVWVLGGAQPAVGILQPRPDRMLGIFDKTSGDTAWQVRGGEVLDPVQSGAMWQVNPAYAESLAAAAQGEDRLWMIFSNDGLSPDRAPYIGVAERVVGACQAELELSASALYLCTRSSQ